MTRRINLLIFLILYFIYTEIVFKYIVFGNIIDTLLTTVLFAIPIGGFIYLIGTFFNEKINKYIIYILLIVLTVLYIGQIIYFKIYGSIFSLASTKNASVVVEYFKFIIDKLKDNFIGVFILIIPLIIGVILIRYKLLDFERSTIREKVIASIALIIFYLIGLISLTNEGMYSNYNLYHNVHSPTLMANNFGLITTMRLDIKRSFLGINENKVIIDPSQKKKEETIYGVNILDINWDHLIDSETNDTIKMMHEYFKGVSPSSKNLYTGLFEGKNLIIILAESFDEIAIDKDVTPTLYKLANEGFNFTNFYTPLFPVSTTDGEYISRVSLVPKEGVWSAYQSRNNYLPFTLGNSFKTLGYKTTAYHNHTGTYYYRNLSHINFGYDEFYACKMGLDINCKLWPESDLEMIEASYESYVNDAPFLTYYITVSGHLQYSKYSSMAIKNWEYVKNLEYSNKVKRYMAHHIELDKALEKLIYELKEHNILEDTVIAISSDHYPYGLTLNEINEKSNEPRTDFFERDKLPFIIWHDGIEPTKVNKLGSSMDILPTLLNLFGIDYDSRLLIGRDLFSDAESIVMFSNRSWITKQGKYNALTKEFFPNKNVNSDNEYIERINQIVYNKFHISELILETDYYRRILNFN